MMKKNLLCLFFLFAMGLLNAGAQDWAKLTLANKSEYTLTVKIMRQSGRLYNTVFLKPKSSTVVSFGSSGNFYTKIKAEKTLEVLYKRGQGFDIYCGSDGYSVSVLEFEVSSYGSSLGSNISKSEFERD